MVDDDDGFQNLFCCCLLQCCVVHSRASPVICRNDNTEGRAHQQTDKSRKYVAIVPEARGSWELAKPNCCAVIDEPVDGAIGI